MLQVPTAGTQIFEVTIYNREVRSLVKENQSHLFYDDQWADVRVHDVLAEDEDQARAIIAERFPPDDGFVIDTIIPTSM